jgi:L-amino acid N-acyltransferase YncA
MKNLLTALVRFIRNLGRPSAAANRRRLRARLGAVSGDPRTALFESIVIRDARADEIPALAALHVRTWNQTYGRVKSPPTVALREQQWREQFQSPDHHWFCLVVENRDGELIGYAKGTWPKAGDEPANEGNLSKIYLLRDYQRLGLGRRLLGLVARRFLSHGVTSMVLFGVPQNPSCAFHDALGGTRLYDDRGVFQGGYRWPDLRRLAEAYGANDSSVQSEPEA